MFHKYCQRSLNNTWKSRDPRKQYTKNIIGMTKRKKSELPGCFQNQVLELCSVVKVIHWIFQTSPNIIGITQSCKKRCDFRSSRTSRSWSGICYLISVCQKKVWYFYILGGVKTSLRYTFQKHDSNDLELVLQF